MIKLWITVWEIILFIWISFNYSKLYCLKFVNSKNYLNLAKIFSQTIKMAKISDCSWLEQRSVIKYLLVAKWKQCEISWKCVVCTVKRIIVGKYFTNGLNVVLPLRARVKNIVCIVKILWFSVEIIILEQQEGYADKLLGHERPITVDYLEKEPL